MTTPGPSPDASPPPSGSGGSLALLALLVVAGVGIGFYQGETRGGVVAEVPAPAASPSREPAPPRESPPPTTAPTSPEPSPPPEASATGEPAEPAARPLPTSPPPEPDSETTPPPPPIPAGPVNPPLPEGALGRLARVLAAPHALAVDPTGKLVSKKKAPPEAVPLASTDPRGYGLRLQALPGIEEFHQWLEDGGRPEALGAAERATLEALDQAMEKVGLLAYFAPYLTARPAAPLEQEAGTWGAVPVPAHRFEGWAAAAARDLRAVLRAVPVRVAAVAKDPEGILGPPPPDADSAGASELATGLAALSSRMGEADARRRAAAWMRPAVQRLRRAMYAAGRALAAEATTREELALIFGPAIEGARLLFHSEAASFSPRRWLGREPSHPAAWCLAGEAVLEGVVAQQAMGADDPARWKRQPELWAKAQATDPETKDTPAAARRFRRALWRVVRFYVLTNAAGAIKKLIFHYRQPLRDDPGQLGEDVLLELGTYLAARPAFPETLGPAEEGFTALAIRRLLASDAKLLQRAALRKTHQDLKGLIRRPRRE